MSSIIITPSDQKELKFLLSLLEKLKVPNRVLEAEELEDLGLALAMKEADQEDKVSEKDIMDLLKSKL